MKISTEIKIMRKVINQCEEDGKKNLLIPQELLENIKQKIRG